MTKRENPFNEQDLRQMGERGLSPEEVLLQIETFRRGFPFSRLARPCTTGDGIQALGEGDPERLAEIYAGEVLAGRAVKFVPASGAASRMFKTLLSCNSRYRVIDDALLHSEPAENDPDHRALSGFLRGLEKFAFFGDLRKAMTQDGIEVETLLRKGEYKPILEYLLTSKGLSLADLPKGLIKFHAYRSHSRTPFEEHLVEASAHVRDRNGLARVHFTVSPEHETQVRDHIEDIRNLYEKRGSAFDVGFSTQRPSTDTLAVDMADRPFRDKDGRLLFRPGGHGALLGNLHDLGGDIVFIKNIDNVVPDRLKAETYRYKRALGGYLVEVQRQLFTYLERLSSGAAEEALLEKAFEFSRDRLSIVPLPGKGLSRRERADYLIRKLDRPLRVCGMVRNVGEPGGGPFWVDHPERGLSLQIVEASQVDMDSAEQREIWESATHFNPVDLVCGVRDYLGRPFDLMRFRDPQTGFISVKSKEGKELKALELPGLWNGAMAEWNTVFVEVPIITFNPVKTVLDLLRKEHQPE